jgi:hypothetical protein
MRWLFDKFDELPRLKAALLWAAESGSTQSSREHVNSLLRNLGHGIINDATQQAEIKHLNEKNCDHGTPQPAVHAEY